MAASQARWKKAGKVIVVRDEADHELEAWSPRG